MSLHWQAAAILNCTLPGVPRSRAWPVFPSNSDLFNFISNGSFLTIFVQGQEIYGILCIVGWNFWKLCMGVRISVRNISKHLNILEKELGLAILDRLREITYSRALSHYCWMRGLLPAAFPPWADSSFLRQPGQYNLRWTDHIDTELSADTRST